MSPPSARLQTKPVITCLKTFLISYSLIFWVSVCFHQICLFQITSDVCSQIMFSHFFFIFFKIKAVLQGVYNKAESVYSGKGNEDLDRIQRTLQCCGEKNYISWVNTDYFKKEGIPKSCCNMTAGVNCTSAELKDLNTAASVVYQRGCFSLMTTTLEANLGIIAGISFGIAFFQLIGIFLAFCLSRYITNNQYEMV
uniref:Tetraspanin 7 n=1 Tax=Cyprinus carpio TaxID=7962 RepID=A0A8C2EDQ9_CYPCA